jgi:hypothetical protein
VPMWNLRLPSPVEALKLKISRCTYGLTTEALELGICSSTGS